MKFFTKEWSEAVKEQSLKNESYLKKTRGWSVKIFLVATNCPDATDRSMECHTQDGKITFVNFEEKPSPSDLGKRPWDDKEYFTRSVATYDLWKKMNNKEWTVMQGISSGLAKIEGRMDEIMRSVGQIAAFIEELLPSIPVEY